MALYSRIVSVLCKPGKCPVCGEPVWDIIYGPGDMTEVEFLYRYRKSASMGGDRIPRRPPLWKCSCGCLRFRKVNPDGTEAKVMGLYEDGLIDRGNFVLVTAGDAVAEKDANYANPHKGCIMLIAAEGDDKDNFEPVEHYYHLLLRHLGWTNLGEIYAGGVLEIGDIKGHPALEDVKELALSI